MKIIEELYKEAQEKGREIYIPYFTDIDMVKKIIHLDIMAFQYVPEKFKTKKFCLYACSLNVIAYLYIPEKYKANKEILTVVLSQYGKMLKYCSTWVRSNKEYVIMAAKNDMDALQFAHPNVYKRPDIAKELIAYHPTAVRYFPKFRNNPKVCVNVLFLNPEYKSYVGPAVIEECKKHYYQLYFFYKDNENRKENPEELI